MRTSKREPLYDSHVDQKGKEFHSCVDGKFEERYNGYEPRAACYTHNMVVKRRNKVERQQQQHSEPRKCNRTSYGK